MAEDSHRTPDPTLGGRRVSRPTTPRSTPRRSTTPRSTPRRAAALAAGLALALAVVGLTACGDDSDDGAAGTTTTTASATTPTTGGTTIPGTGTGSTGSTEPGTTASTPSTETTVLVPDSSPVSTPADLIPLAHDPQDYADELVRAWGKRFTAYVDRLAAPDAAAVLAAHDDLEGSSWTRSACEGAAGSSYCTYTADGGTQLVVRVGNEAASQGQERAVTEVRFE
jgi:hypothetical protein